MVEIKELLDAGVHFGHSMDRWNPKMARYIFGERGRTYIIDLNKTAKKLAEATDFVRDCVAAGGTILFVGTKRQAQSIVEEGAKQCDMFYVCQRWLGGMLTNFMTIRKSVDRLKKLEAYRTDGTYDRLTKKEISQLEKEHVKLEKSLGGIRNMTSLPSAIFVVDIRMEQICVAEANRLKIPIVAVIDTDCDPDRVDYIIPGNDDGGRSVRFITQAIANAVLEGKKLFTPAVPDPATTPSTATPVEATETDTELTAATIAAEPFPTPA